MLLTLAASNYGTACRAFKPDWPGSIKHQTTLLALTRYLSLSVVIICHYLSLSVRAIVGAVHGVSPREVKPSVVLVNVKVKSSAQVSDSHVQIMFAAVPCRHVGIDAAA